MEFSFNIYSHLLQWNETLQEEIAHTVQGFPKRYVSSSWHCLLIPGMDTLVGFAKELWKKFLGETFGIVRQGNGDFSRCQATCPPLQLLPPATNHRSKKWKIRFFFLEKHLKMITNKSRFDITLLSVLPFYSNVTWPAPYGVVLNGIAVLLPLDMSKISPEYLFKTKLVHIPPTLLNFRTFLGNTRV